MPKIIKNGRTYGGFGTGGSGGGSNVEIVKITMGELDPNDPSRPIPVQSVDKTWSELEAAVLAGKIIIANCSTTTWSEAGTRTSDILFILQPFYNSTALYSLSGEFSSSATHYALYWDGSYALPSVSLELVEDPGGGGDW